jgi:tetratricopeptide (TPR) repeat protein
MVRLLTFICFVALLFPLYGQETLRKKPVLIRADETENKVEEVPLTPDPAKAKEHLEIGDFYYKRDNYKAAAERYRDAIKYNPKWIEPYERLIRVLEKQKAFSEAVKVCEQFAETNPASEEVRRFQIRAQRLKEKSGNKEKH